MGPLRIPLRLFLSDLRLRRCANGRSPGIEFGEQTIAVLGTRVGEVVGFSGILGEIVEFDFLFGGEVEQFEVALSDRR